MSSTDEFLFGSGGGSAKFENVGDTITGTITNTEVKQQTDLASGAPQTWDNGDPKMQLVVTLQTALRDPDNADDEGKRNIYVKGSKKPGSQSLHDAVATAVRTAGAKGLEEGGTLTVTYIGDEPSATRGFNPRKLWSATYAKPSGTAATQAFLAAPAPAAAPAAVAPAAPAAAPAPAPAAAPTQLTPEMAAAFAQYQAQQAASA